MSGFGTRRPFQDDGLHTVTPRQGRRIHSPVQGINTRAVSDLIPTASVTETFPNLGVTVYSECQPGVQNQEATGFENYVAYFLRDEGYREGGWFTRVFFGPPPAITYPATVTPLKTTWSSKTMLWDQILEAIAFVPDSSTSVQVQNSAGVVSLMPRIRIQYSIRPELEVPTTIREDWFVSPIPFDLNGINFADLAPHPTDISWEIDPLGRDGTIPRCLHKKEITPVATQRYGITNYQTRKFPETNQVTWQDYPIAFDVQEDPPFYIGVLKTAIAPSLTDIVKIIL